MAAVSRTPYQWLWVGWVSLEELCLHLVDYPDLLAEVIGEMGRIIRDTFRATVQVARQTEVAYINVPDNITAPVIGERYFRQFCMPFYQELADMLAAAGLDIPVAVHMDGDLRPLWQAIAESPVRVLDSFSPSPDNDTRVDDALRIWLDKRLGMNFPSSVHLRQANEVYAATMDIIQQAGRTGRLMIQISENVPANVWRTSLPQIVRAIKESDSNRT